MESKKNLSDNNDMKMKAIVLGALFVSFIVGYMVSRAKYKPQIEFLTMISQETAKTLEEVKSQANKIMMKDGKMMMMEAGKLKELEKDYIVSNGDKVTTDGKVEKTDGGNIELQNGDVIDMNGRIIYAKQEDK